MLRHAALLAALLASTAYAAGQEFSREAHCKTYAALDAPVGTFYRIAEAAGIADGQAARISTSAIQVQQGQSVAALISERGFRPDAANIALTGHLNPHIDDLQRIDVGEVVFVPQIELLQDAGWVATVPETPLDGFAVERRIAREVALQVYEESQETYVELAAAIAARADPDPEMSEYLGALEATVPSSLSDVMGWRDFSQFLESYEPQLAQADRAARIATEVVQNVRAPAATPSDNMTRTAALDPGQIGAGHGVGLVSYQLNIFDKGNTPLEGLSVKYMSRGTYTLGCPRSHGVPFASPSHAARQVLPRATFVIWVEDGASGRHSKPITRDMRLYETTVVENLVVEWVDD